MSGCVKCLFLFLVAMAVMASTASAQCVSGTVTAELQDGGPFDGLWKYTAEITWDTPQGLSNVTLDCGFGDCADIACEQTYLFDDPAGTGEGEGGCTVEFAGEFNCGGNPSIGLDIPIIKWDALNEGCEPGNMGSATLCFYTSVPPHPDAQLPIVLVKNGQSVCEEMISGDCPALCVIPNQESTWGGIKVNFRSDDG